MSNVSKRIQAAADAFDWAAVDHAASDFVSELRASALPASRDEYDPVLRVLRDHRRFGALVQVIDELLSRSVQDPVVARHYGQALIEQGYPSAALATLTAVAANPDAKSEWIEARGSMGRCHKELYLRTIDPDRRAEELRQALSGYLDSYVEEPAERYWLGINAVALLARAEGERIDVPDHPFPGEESRRLATTVLEAVRQMPDNDAWAQATAVEALVAQGDTSGAEKQLERYIKIAKPNAFALNSLLRQLTEMWKLDVTTPPGSTLLPQLRSELLDKTGGVVSLDPSEIRAERLERLSHSEHLEKVLGTDRYQTLNWYIKGLERCRAVARIETENEDGIGTGFLVRGGDLAPGLPELVLMTNGHVIPGDVEHRRGRCRVPCLHGRQERAAAIQGGPPVVVPTITVPRSGHHAPRARRAPGQRDSGAHRDEGPEPEGRVESARVCHRPSTRPRATAVLPAGQPPPRLRRHTVALSVPDRGGKLGKSRLRQGVEPDRSPPRWIARDAPVARPWLLPSQ